MFSKNSRRYFFLHPLLRYKVALAPAFMPACPYWVLSLGESNESVRVRMDGHLYPKKCRNQVPLRTFHGVFFILTEQLF